MKNQLVIGQLSMQCFCMGSIRNVSFKKRQKMVAFPLHNSCSHNLGWRFTIFSNKPPVFLAAVQTTMALPLQWLVAPVNVMTSCVWSWKLDGTYKRAPVYRNRKRSALFSQESAHMHAVPGQILR